MRADSALVMCVTLALALQAAAQNGTAPWYEPNVGVNPPASAEGHGLLQRQPTRVDRISTRGPCLSLQANDDGGEITPFAVGVPTAAFFQAALESTGLDVELAELPGNVTVFAPSDLAFKRAIHQYAQDHPSPMDEETENFRWESGPELKRLLLAHVVEGTHPASGLEGEELTTMGNETISVEAGEPGRGMYVIIAGTRARVTREDVELCNGLLNLVDEIDLEPREGEDEIKGD